MQFAALVGRCDRHYGRHLDRLDGQWQRTRTRHAGRLAPREFRTARFISSRLRYSTHWCGAVRQGQTSIRCHLPIADGAMRRGMFEGGQTVIVNGASGQLGSAAVILAIAREAGRIVAVGRNELRLAALSALSDRVAAVALTGDTGRDLHGVKHAASGGADLLLDYLADTPMPQTTASSIEALRPGGTAVLTGGVKSGLPINYAHFMRNQLTIRGSFMFSRSGALSTWNLLRSDALSLQPVRSPTGLAWLPFDDAMTVSATLGGTDMAVLLPNG